MGKNYIKQWMEDNDLEFNEEFKIKGLNEDARIISDDYSIYNTFTGYYESSTELLSGRFEIEKFPWKPKDGEIYYYVGIVGDKVQVLDTTYVHGNDFCELCLKKNNYFKTFDEAHLYKCDLVDVIWNVIN